MSDERFSLAYLFPTGYPKAPVKTTWPKYIGENGLELIRNNPENSLESVRPERILSVSGEENDSNKGTRK